MVARCTAPAIARTAALSRWTRNSTGVIGGLTAGEILARTHGNLAFFAFYSLFVVAVAFHAPIGLRNVIREWTPWRSGSLDLALAVFAVMLLVLGFRAVFAVYAA